MRAYTVHLKPDRPPLLSREGWSWAAFVFGPLWLLIQRAWIPALLQLAALGILIAVVPAPIWRPFLLGVFLLNGLLGRDMTRWSLERRGYALSHVVLARDGESALLRLAAARPDLVARLA